MTVPKDEYCDVNAFQQRCKHFVSLMILGHRYFWAMSHGQGNQDVDVTESQTISMMYFRSLTTRSKQNISQQRRITGRTLRSCRRSYDLRGCLSSLPHMPYIDALSHTL